MSADPNFGVIGYEVIPYALPFRDRYVTARGALSRREMVLVRAHTRDGIIGLGEAVPLSLRGGSSLEQVSSELRRFAIDFGDASETEKRSFFLEARELSPPSRCAISTAWDDLLGKREGVPVWKLHGAQEPADVPCNATLSVGDPDAVADAARRWAEDGFQTFKLKLGLANDVEQVEAVRAALGPAAKLRVDANGAWGPAEAASKLERMSPFDIELVEQPCATLEELAQVREAVDILVVADESVANWSQAERACELQACDYATLKLSKVGGALDAKAIAGEIPSYLSSALDGPIGIAAAAHAAQALYLGGIDDPGLAHGLATQRLFDATIASRECELRDGLLHLPEGPGLGVEIDDALLEAARL
jgi:L-alanine-DL-glutamate epimerase-like enolase superfamily enzyme